MYSRFGDNATHLLPNKNDIHPNLEGHKVMSTALLDEIIREVADIKEHWAEKELQELADKGFIIPDKNKKGIQKKRFLGRKLPKSFIRSSLIKMREQSVIQDSVMCR